MSSSVVRESARQNIPSITEVVHAVQFVRKSVVLPTCPNPHVMMESYMSLNFFNNPQGPNVLAKRSFRKRASERAQSSKSAMEDGVHLTQVH